MEKREILFSLVIGLCLCLMVADSAAEFRLWQKLDDGLYLGAFDPKKKSKIFDGKIITLRLDLVIAEGVHEFHFASDISVDVQNVNGLIHQWPAGFIPYEEPCGDAQIHRWPA